MIKKLYLYIAKKFLFVFLWVLLSVSLLLAVINVFELLGKVSDKPINLWQIILLDLLPIPSFLEKISVFLIMFSAMISLFSLSVRSEIVVMRSCGLSLFKIITPVILSSLLIGALYLKIFNPASIKASLMFNQMERELIDKKKSDLLSPANGIWIKQDNLSNAGQEIIIRADKIYRNNLKMKNVSLWFFDENLNFYKKINGKNMVLSQGSWVIKHASINDQNNVNLDVEEVRILSNLKPKFIINKILSNFEDPSLFTISSLPSIIVDIKDSGSSPRKFIVYYHSMLAKPFLFAGMCFIAAFFAINNTRSRNNGLLFILGIVVGLILYVVLVVSLQFGSSGIIPVFLSTWTMAIMLLFIGIMLIFKKE